MSMLTDWVTLVSGHTAAGARVYPNVAPDAPTKPYIVFQRIAANSENVLKGRTGLINTRLQIDVFSDTALQAQSIAASIDTLMDGWSTQNISNPAQDQFEPDVKLHRVILDYSIWHT